MLPVCGSGHNHEKLVMQKILPARPNLDHLRRQAKALLAALEARETDAIATMIKHLPAARNLTAAEVTERRFRLADAQSAIARQNGFAAWPHLARHVEQLRALEGTWEFTRLEIDGSVLPAAALAASRLFINGDRFRTESPEGVYEGIFNINVEADPSEIDIEFIEGPEAGNWNFGIFRLDGNKLEICLDMKGKPRPHRFATSRGSGRAYEILKRASKSRPENVKGGIGTAIAASSNISDASSFEFVESVTARKLQGDWKAVKIIRDGQELPSMVLRTVSRTTDKNELKVSVAGQTMIHAFVRLDESTTPMGVDYYNLGGACKGTIQYGLLKWEGEEICSCMAAPGQPRPADFTCLPGSGRTFSQWRPK